MLKKTSENYIFFWVMANISDNFASQHC